MHNDIINYPNFQPVRQQIIEQFPFKKWGHLESVTADEKGDTIIRFLPRHEGTHVAIISYNDMKALAAILHAEYFELWAAQPTAGLTIQVPGYWDWGSHSPL